VIIRCSSSSFFPLAFFGHCLFSLKIKPPPIFQPAASPQIAKKALDELN